MLLIVFIGCKKDIKSTPDKNVESSIYETPTVPFSENGLQINSDYDFLVFDDVDDIDSYLDFVVGHTHGEMRTYLDSLGFTSLGKSYFGNLASNDSITANQAPLYSLNEDGVVEIQDVVIKQLDQNRPIASWDFFLTMVDANLSNSNYEDLSSGIYQSSTMNQFANGEELSHGLFEFIEDTPNGYENNDEAAKTKFWGLNEINGPTLITCGNCICIHHVYRRTIFWIWIGQEIIWDEPTNNCVP